MKFRRLCLAAAAALALGLQSCAPSVRDVAGIYGGIIHDTSDKPTEYFMQLYADQRYALRRTVIDDEGKTSCRTGTWTIEGRTVVLRADAEKDLRFAFERGALRLNANVQGVDSLPYDQTTLPALYR